MTEEHRRLAKAVRTVEALPSGEQSRRVIEAVRSQAVPTYGRVIASTPIGFYRWAYQVQGMVWNGFSNFVPDGKNYTGVRNLNEWYNSLGYCGNGVHAGNVPGNFEVQSADIGKPLVILYSLSGLPFFIHVNGVDGVCS